MKILISDPIAEDGINMLKENGFEVDVKTGMEKSELMDVIGNYNGIVVRSATKLTSDVIEKADNMKIIVRGGVGIDNIDVKAAEAKGIKVQNTPTASTVSVAELVFAHLLSLTRKITEADKSMKEGKWEKKKLKGIEIYKKNLGLIGTGRIGMAVAKRAKAFEMEVFGYDPYQDPNIMIDNDIKPVDKLDDILNNADIISIHSPLTDDTKHLINKESIDKMKDGVIIINCARGGIIDESALYDGLSSGKIAGASLDVYEKEPPENSPLLKLDNIILTPHIGASTKEAQKRVGIESAKTIIQFFNS